MAKSKANAARVRLGDLAADLGRVVVRRWALLVVAAVSGALPVIMITTVWFYRWTDEIGRFGAGAIVRVLVQLVVYSVFATFLAALAISVLTDEPLPRVLSPRRLALGLSAALALNLLVAWASLAMPAIFAAAGPVAAGVWVAAGSLLAMIPTSIFWLLAVPAAIGEGRSVLAALSRSAQLQRRLRWFSLGLYLAYLLLLGVLSVVTVTVFRAVPGGVNPSGRGPWQAAVAAEALLLGGLFQIVGVALFVQARRIADGPSAAEIGEVFA